jgi:hypothetical protein
MAFSSAQRRSLARYRRLLMHCQEILRMAIKVDNDLGVITCGGRDLNLEIVLGPGRKFGKVRLIRRLAFGTLYQYSSCT